MFSIPDGLVDQTYVPEVNDEVIFTPGDGHTTLDVQKAVAAQPIACTLSASPTSIPIAQAGNVAVTLSWTSSGADSLSIEGIGPVKPVAAGSKDVYPTSTTTYILTATNTTSGAPPQSASAKVTVS